MYPISKIPPRRNCDDQNVVAFPFHVDSSMAFDRLTARLVLAQHQAGALNPAIVEALLAGVGLQP
jgi:hypothetical protein